MDTVKIGNVAITALIDVDVEDDPIHEAFPAIPEEVLRSDRSGHAEVLSPDGRWRLRVRAWLVEHPDGLLLMDTGMCGPGSPALRWFPEGMLRAALADAGASPGDIDTVALSHVHDDHLGGTVTAEHAPAFPNARYVLQRADLEWQQARAATDEWTRDVRDALIAPLEAARVLDVIEGDRRLSDSLELHHAPGHTPGHQVLRIRSDGAAALIVADAFNHPAQFAHPEWPSGSDHDPPRTAETRRRILDELASAPATIVAPTHFGTAFGRIAPDAGGTPGWVGAE